MEFSTPVYYKLGAKLLKIFQISRKNAEKRAKDKRIYSFILRTTVLNCKHWEP